MKSKKKIFIGKTFFSQLEVPLSVNFGFMSQWNNPRESKLIKGKAWNVSRTGLCLETGIKIRDGVLEFSETDAKEKVKVLPYLVSSEQEIKVETNLPPNKNRMLITGKPIWYEFNSGESISKLKIGVLFTEMPREARGKWAQYIKQADSFEDFNRSS